MLKLRFDRYITNRSPWVTVSGGVCNLFSRGVAVSMPLIFRIFLRGMRKNYFLFLEGGVFYI